ncbi:MAG TPA: LuxR C-terminal-related transcriptional regulator [Allosphingosinicella sp.]|nr:LuxR C-terminal-related transcriptional regulator [Allosphingosinicella sp.]
MSHQRKVYVVGRNEEVRRLLTQHVGSVGAEAWPFASGADFLDILDHLGPACVLLDMDGSDVSGLEILAEMGARDIAWPVIAISGREELQLVIETMKLGALDFLRLPLSRELLALALAPAWRALERVVEAGESRRAAQQRLGRLTAREMDVLLALLGGRFNKAIAHDFGISVRTVEMHRAHIMAKLEVKSLAEAALLAPQAGLHVPSGDSPATRARGPVPAPGSYAGADCRGQLSALARRLSS